MRRFDNATPAGIFLGDDGPRTWLPGDAPCCRDGYARLSLVRPLHWVRPKGPSADDLGHRVYRLCAKCVQRRLSCGAHGSEGEEYSRHLAWH